MPEKYKNTASKLLEKYMVPVKVNGVEISCLRDTGATFDVICQDLVKSEDYTGEEACFRQALNDDPCFLPLARVKLEGKFGSLETIAAVARNPAVSYLISNQTAEQCKGIDKIIHPTLAVTRLMQKKLSQRLARELEEQDKAEKESSSRIPEVPENDTSKQMESDLQSESLDEEHSLIEDVLAVNREKFIHLQKADPTLQHLFELANKDSEDRRSSFIIKEGLLTRIWPDKNGCPIDQLVLPVQLRKQVLELAHSHCFSGHLGMNKTKKRVSNEFYYPGIFKEIQEFVKTCEVCQKVGYGKDEIKAKLRTVPLISEPFKRLSVDIIGPLPQSSDGYAYVLTAQCMATRFPDGIPLKQVKAEDVVDAMLQIFARYGFPSELQTDLGSVFTSQLMKIFAEKTGIKHYFSSVCHPQSNPVERMHRTLKQILKALLLDKGGEWVQWLPMALFAIRQVPNESSGFSPGELVFGRVMKGPLSLLRDHWNPTDNKQTVVEYVLKLLERLYKSAEIANQLKERAQRKAKLYYDKKARDRNFKEGDSVLILVPNKPHKLTVKWEGPVHVLKQLSEVNYIVEGTGKRHKQRLVHANLMKPFHERISNLQLLVNQEQVDQNDTMICPFEKDSQEDFESWLDDTVGKSDLNSTKAEELKEVIRGFSTVFSKTPGRTNILEHDIELTESTPIRSPPYRMNPRVKELVRKEIETMLNLNLIRPSSSDYAAPVILVEAPGKPPRAVIDYRKLNAVSKMPQYPTKNVEEQIEKVASANYVTILDLTRGYWQMPLTERASRLAAFTCFLGTYEPTVLSFGLTGGPMSFQRLMDKVLDGCEHFADALLDDIAIFSSTWEEHLEDVREVLKRLRAANLVVQRRKCQWARNQVLYLGHEVGRGKLSPSSARIQAIINMDIPESKKQLKSFLGMCNYYRRYIPCLSDIATPLTDALRKQAPQALSWSAEMNQAFSKLKSILSSHPVLKAPDHSAEFFLQTDASSRAISGVLRQRIESGKKNIPFSI